MAEGFELVTTGSSRLPMRAMPAGVITFSAESAFTTSAGLRPRAASLAESMSTDTCRPLPP
jgi:hypothetical protein